MNLTKKITLALGLLAAGTSFAQNVDTSNGLLGQRFAEVNFSFIETDSVSKLSYAPALSLNLPVLPSLLDVGAGYSYARVRGPLKGHDHTFGVYAVGYMALDGVKPFLGASLDYNKTSLSGGFSDESHGWSVAAGFEVPVGAFTITPSITHSDDFENGFGEGDNWTYRVEGNVWLNRRTAAFAAVSKIDLGDTGIDVWTYQVGVRFRF